MRQFLNERGPVDRAARDVARQGFVRQYRPQIRRPASVFRCERQTGLFPRAVIVVRSRRLEIERQNEKTPQKPPDRHVVGRRIGCGKMMTESLDELPHAVRSKSRAPDLRRKGFGIGELTRPLQHLLAIALDTRRASRDGDGHFIAMHREARLLRRGPKATNHVGEIRIAAREVDRALRLKIEEGFRSVGVERIDRHVVERPAGRRLLEANGARHGAGQAARLGRRKERKHVERADLAFEARAGGPGGGGGGGGGRLCDTEAHEPLCSVFVRQAIGTVGPGPGLLAQVPVRLRKSRLFSPWRLIP